MSLEKISYLAIKIAYSVAFLSAGSAWGESLHQKRQTFKIQPTRITNASGLTLSTPIVPEPESIILVDPESSVAAENDSKKQANDKRQEPEWRFSIQPTILLPFRIKGTATVEGPFRLQPEDLLERIDIPTDAVPEELLLLPGQLRDRASNLEFARPESGSVDISNGIIVSSIDYDLDLEDVLSFDQAIRLSGRFEAWKDRLGFTFDGQYTRVKLTGDASIGPIQIEATNGNIITTETARFDLEYVTEMATFDLATSYHFGNDTRNQASDQSPNGQFPLFFAEPYAGIRIGYIGQEAKIDPGSDLDADAVYLDPILGARLGLQVSDKVTFGVRGDVGGFGVGTNLTWFLVAGLDWHFAQSTSLRFAYRIYDMDFNTENDNGRDFDLEYQEQGIWLGFNFYL
jgi:opacity protein-like surface antigen